jgi:hypothetical protein
MSTIAAGTTSGTALVSTGDTTGQLVLQTNGTTTAVTIGTNQVVTLAQPLPVASGGTGGSATPTAGGIVYGTGTVQAVTAAGTSGQLLQSNAASAPTWVTFSAGITLGTSVATTSGTSIDITGIPAGTKQITVMLNGVSTNGTSPLIVQIGDAGGIESTGYNVEVFNATATSHISSSFKITLAVIDANTYGGSLILNLQESSSFTWVAQGFIADNSNAGFASGGFKSLSATLDRVRLTTQGGTDTFDAGNISISYQ